jgi:lipoprotein-anchoring transpeptidase ErfK/SrfK
MLVVGALALAANVCAAVTLAHGAKPEGSHTASKALALSVAHARAREAAALTAMSGVHDVWRWAFVLRRTAARAAPARAARVVSVVGARTPEGTTNLVLVLMRLRRSDGGVWYRVRLPVLPNNSTGWIDARALGRLRVVRTHLVVDRRRYRATLFRSGRPIFVTRVGVGRPGSPTPAGQFYVRDLVLGFHDPFYGPAAFGTSARSAVLTDWPAGGYIGIHGTDRPGILPGRVSHGCVRMRNSAIVRLVRLMPVGTPVTIR